MTEMKKFEKALESMAAVFSEAYEHTDRQSGEVTERNRKAFMQGKLLNAVCYALANGLEYSHDNTLPRARARVQQALREHNGTEITEQALQRAVDWVQQLTEQMAFDEAALAVAEGVHEKRVGKAFVYGRRAQVGEGNAVETPAMAAARAMGIVGNVAAGFNNVADGRTQQRERLPAADGSDKPEAIAERRRQRS